MSISFLSNHARVLAMVAAESDVRLRDVAVRLGITERAVQRIVAELEREGLLSRAREGRRNRYEVRRDARLDSLLDLAFGPGAPPPAAPPARPRQFHSRREDSFID
ncbi:MAG: MarR family transcriptional regulator [Deltaproteobacteria bacterium]|nr:MAG: MarR family transcriptional regulator [Deltaproteobacteria bacterium]TMB35253.1 MAG: MarR family transcriptional regulator [Deltaproteobacteria bacterium]